VLTPDDLRDLRSYVTDTLRKLDRLSESEAIDLSYRITAFLQQQQARQMEHRPEYLRARSSQLQPSSGRRSRDAERREFAALADRAAGRQPGCASLGARFPAPLGETTLLRIAPRIRRMVGGGRLRLRDRTARATGQPRVCPGPGGCPRANWRRWPAPVPA
jgi:hypothetical protein